MAIFLGSKEEGVGEKRDKNFWVRFTFGADTVDLHNTVVKLHI